MNTHPPDTSGGPPTVWVIDEGRFGGSHPETLDGLPVAGPTRQYRLSQLGRYMIQPGPVEVSKRLVGCELQPLPPRTLFGRRFARWLPGPIGRRFAPSPPAPQVVLGDDRGRLPPLQTEDLLRHWSRLEDALRPFDPALQALAAVAADRIEDVVGICEDAGGQRSYLNIQGDIREKLDYVQDHLHQDVQVILDRAYTNEGLFDLIGFDFKVFDADQSCALIRFQHDGKPRAAVLDGDDRFDFWVEDTELIHYLILFQQSIQSNPRLSASLALCTADKALPLKIYFKNQLNILYSGTNLPAVYKEIFEKCDTTPQARETVLGVLKDRQVGVSFNYVPREITGSQRLFTEVSVLQDCRVLDAVRDHLPDLVSEVSRRASVSEIGRFYLLDSMRGFRNEQ